MQLIACPAARRGRPFLAAILATVACGPIELEADVTEPNDRLPPADAGVQMGATGDAEVVVRPRRDAAANPEPTDAGFATDSGERVVDAGEQAMGPDEQRNALLARLPSPVLPTTVEAYAGDPRPEFARSPMTDAFDSTPSANPITDAGATLGRVLFYDRLLSANGEVSCASCHLQQFAFTDPRPLSVGFEGGATGRNSMPLINLRFYGGGQRSGAMFWDHRAPTLEAQVLMPIQDAVEMGVSLDELILRVSAASYYPALFEAAFGSEDVTTDRIARALAQFVRAITAFNSLYDQGLAQANQPTDDFANFTAQQNEGKRLFFGPPGGPGPGRGPSCAACHLPGGPGNSVFFFVDGAKNNGLPDDQDVGFGAVTGRPGDDRRFKSPSLRNVEMTGPYMHDGRFRTLDEVIRFYAGGIRADPNLDPVLRGPNGQPVQFRFTPPQRAALVAFLRTLTDRDVLTDQRFADPFLRP